MNKTVACRRVEVEGFFNIDSIEWLGSEMQARNKRKGDRRG